MFDLRRTLNGIRFRRAARAGYETCMWAYPKSGGTWLRFMLAACADPIEGLEHDFRSLDAVSGSVEAFLPLRKGQRADISSFDLSIPLKSHDLPSRNWLSEKKSIFMVRHPAATMISLARHRERNGHGAPSAAQLVAELTTSSIVNYAPWGTQAETALMLPADRCLIVRYEDLRENPEPTLSSIARFAGLSVNDAQTSRIVRQTTKRSIGTKEASSYRNTRGFASGQSSDLLVDSQFEDLVRRRVGHIMTELGYSG